MSAYVLSTKKKLYKEQALNRVYDELIKLDPKKPKSFTSL